ncbi:hypothetical protein ABK040_008355 [Willaertia magna]
MNSNINELMNLITSGQGTMAIPQNIGYPQQQPNNNNNNPQGGSSFPQQQFQNPNQQQLMAVITRALQQQQTNAQQGNNQQQGIVNPNNTTTTNNATNTNNNNIDNNNTYLLHFLQQQLMNNSSNNSNNNMLNNSTQSMRPPNNTNLMNHNMNNNNGTSGSGNSVLAPDNASYFTNDNNAPINNTARSNTPIINNLNNTTRSGTPISNNSGGVLSTTTTTTANSASMSAAHSNSGMRRFSVEQIKLVQQLIEQCLKLYLSKNETIDFLCRKYENIEPGFISLMWSKLEQQNPDFFKAYNIRLQIKDQITTFNQLVNDQAKLMQQQGVLVHNTVSSNTNISPNNSVSSVILNNNTPSTTSSTIGNTNNMVSLMNNVVGHNTPNSVNNNPIGVMGHHHDGVLSGNPTSATAMVANSNNGGFFASLQQQQQNNNPNVINVMQDPTSFQTNHQGPQGLGVVATNTNPNALHHPSHTFVQPNPMNQGLPTNQQQVSNIPYNNSQQNNYMGYNQIPNNMQYGNPQVYNANTGYMQRPPNVPSTPQPMKNINLSVSLSINDENQATINNQPPPTVYQPPPPPQQQQNPNLMNNLGSILGSGDLSQLLNIITSSPSARSTLAGIFSKNPPNIPKPQMEKILRLLNSGVPNNNMNDGGSMGQQQMMDMQSHHHVSGIQMSTSHNIPNNNNIIQNTSQYVTPQTNPIQSNPGISSIDNTPIFDENIDLELDDLDDFLNGDETPEHQ